MATVKAFIRPTSRKGNKTEVAVRFRLSDGANVQLYHTSDIMVDPEVWDAKKECIKAKVLYHRIKRINFTNSIMDRKELMLGIYSKLSKKKNITSEEFGILIDQALHPENYNIEEEEAEKDFFDYYTSFLDIKEYEPSDRKNFDTMGRLLKRFELFVSLKTRKDFKLVFEELNVDTIRELDYYIRNEHLFVSDPDYKVIFEEIPEKRRPQLRGRNTVIKIMKRFRTFIKWAMKEQLLHNDPFVGYELKSPQYGTPYYITVEERTKIAETDLHAAWKALPKEQRNTIKESMIPQLEIQLDIFIFHCMIGCRVGDLVQFTWKNVINDHISYIARKTSKECVESIEVPLNNTAKAILSNIKTSFVMTDCCLRRERHSVIRDLSKTAVWQIGGERRYACRECRVADADSQRSQTLFYSKSSKDAEERMEIDFLLQKDKVTSRHNIRPVEVKSGKNYTLSSLNKCVKKFSEYTTTPTVLHAADYKVVEGITYLPIYMTPLL